MSPVAGVAGSPAKTASQRARRDRIVAAATELLDEREYERIQVRDVADDADVALATLYRYFPSKEQLYVTVLHTWADSFDLGTGTKRPSASSDAARLRATLRRAVRAYERHPNFYRLITVLEGVTDPVVVARYAEFAGRFGDTLRATLEDVDDEDADTIVRLTSALLGSLLRSWSQGRLSIGRVRAELDRAVDLLFRGAG